MVRLKIHSPKLKKGFTLIELLIVITIIALLAISIFVALDPLSRFRDARDARRASAVSTIVSAIKIDQVDNGGTYLTAVANMTAGNVYMVGTDAAGCDDYNANCDTNVTNDTACVDISGLVSEGYMGAVPISPNGAGTWVVGHTGYTLTRATTGIITTRACESENTTEIFVAQ